MQAQAELSLRFGAHLPGFGGPLAAGDDHLLERVGFDVHASLETLGDEAGDGGLAGSLDAGNDDDAGEVGHLAIGC